MSRVRPATVIHQADLLPTSAAAAGVSRPSTVRRSHGS